MRPTKQRPHTDDQSVPSAAASAASSASLPVAAIVGVKSFERPLASPPLSAETLLARWRRLPDLDSVALRADIDVTLDARL